MLFLEYICCYKNNNFVRYPDDLDIHYKYYNSDGELKEEMSDHDDTCYL